MTSRPSSDWNISLLGASTLQGKEVKAVLEERHLPVRRLQLVDTEDFQGQLTDFEGEPAIVQPVNSETFQDKDLVIFASGPTFTSQHWRQARGAGCGIIDLSYFLETEPEARHWAPLIEHFGGAGSIGAPLQPTECAIAISAHPMSIALAGTLKLLSDRARLVRAVATIFEPASQRGQAGVEELHQQTVSLLSFQEIPKKIFDAQVSFNLLTRHGERSQPTLRSEQERIANHLNVLLRGRALPPALRLLQVPVFHGYSFNLWVELTEPIEVTEMETVLDQPPFSLSRAAAEQPNAVSAASSDHILLGAVERDPANTSSYWIWGAFDNLRIAALNAERIVERMMGWGSRAVSAPSGGAAHMPPLRS